MAYTPTEWECGDTITAEKLNAMERGVADMNTEYVPNEWKCGDVVSAEKLNHMEQGIANGCGGSSDLKNKTTILTFVNDTAYDMSRLEGVRSVINENGLVKITTRSLPQQNATETIETLNIPTDDMGTGITLPALPMSTTGTYSYVASNAINCELQSSFIPSVVITDDALDASITLTITFTAS